MALFKQIDSELAHHPLARHLIAQIERRSRRNSEGAICDGPSLGQIKFEQFAEAVLIMERGVRDEKLEWLFDLHDLDGNGTIDKLEMMEIIKVFFVKFIN